MDCLRLRKMARKSVFDGGQKKGLSVQQVLDLNDSFYLVFSYYKYETISFLDDILDELKIPLELRIEKPGANLKMYEEYKCHWRNISTNIERMAASQRFKGKLNREARKNDRCRNKISKAKQCNDNRHRT